MHAYTLPLPPVMSGSPDVVTALIDKNIVAHNGMIDEPVSIFLPSLQNIMSVLSARTGRTSLTRNSILSKFRATVRSWIRRLAGSLLFNSPFIWLCVRTHFSLMMSCRYCLTSSSTSTLFRPPRGLSTPFSKLSRDDSSRRGTINSNMTATNK